MGRAGDWTRLVAVAAAYAVAFVVSRRAMTFSLESPWFVCLAMVCFLGLAFVARPVIPISVPRSMRRIRAWEADGTVYRRLRVPAFGRLLRRTPLRLLNRDVYLEGTGRSLGDVLARLEAAEASHFWAALLAVPYMIRLCLIGEWSALFWVAVAQLLINAYPVMHLRLARQRLGRLGRFSGQSRGTARSRRSP